MRLLGNSSTRHAFMALVLWVCGFSRILVIGQEWEYSIDDVKTFPIHKFEAESVAGNFVVLFMAQDSKGFIWSGTDHGLLRFDGSRFVQFKHDPENENSLDSDFVSSLFCDSKDRLFVGTSAGLLIYREDTEDFEKIPILDKSIFSRSNVLVRRIVESRLGDLFLATNGAGVFALDENLKSKPLSAIAQNPEEGMNNWKVNRVYFDKTGRLWISTIENGMYWYYPDTGILESGNKMGSLTESLAGHEVRALLDSGDGHFWLGTHGNGIVKWNEKENTSVHYGSASETGRPFASKSIRNIAEDFQGNIWIGTQEVGLFVYDREKDEFASISHSGPVINRLGAGSITSLLTDNRGDIWFSVLYSGTFSIFHLNMHPAGFRHALVENERGVNLAKTSVLSAFEDSRGDLWIGTDGDGLIRKTDSSVQVFKFSRRNPKSLSNNRVTSIQEDEDGIMWIGTRNGGLNKFDPDSEDFERIPIGTSPSSIRGKAIWSLHSKGNYLWVGTEIGISVFDIAKNKAVNPKHLFGDNFSMPKRAVWSIENDGQGRIWIASLSGLYFGDYSENEQSSDSQGGHFQRVSDYRSQSLTKDTDGSLYVATLEEGVFRIDENQSLTRPFKAGLNFESNILHSIGRDKNDDFWITSDFGFIKVDGKSGKQTLFDSRWDFEAQYYWVHSNHLGSDGKMYFPSRKGLLFFDPDQIGFRTEMLQPRITTVEGFDKEVWPDAHKVRFSTGKDPDNFLSFSHDEAVLTFHYSALFYPQPDSVEYQTFFKGIDKDWSPASHEFSTSYPLLPPGDFEFKVRARISGQDWGEPSEALAIRVLNPFYFRWWFVTAVICLLVVTVYIMLQLRVKKINAQRSILEATVSERTNELKKTNEQILKQRDELEFHRNNLEEQVSSRTAELETAKFQAEESSRLKTAFLANMSHEIRTPLNSIVNFSQLLFDQNLDDQKRTRFQEIVENSSDSLLHLIDDVLDIARLEAGELKVDKKPCDVTGLVKRLEETYLGKIQSHKLDLKIGIEMPEDFVDEIETDDLRLNQILVNLLDNAVKFTESGEVVFGFTVQGDMLEFFVRDTGVGIAEENISKIFDRFTKIEEDRQKFFPGTGLGLAISKRLVALLGGQLTVQSKEGEGSVFYFTIPNKVFRQISSEIDSQSNGSLRAFDWRNYTILLVEDENSNVEVLNAFLSPTSARLVYAEDGKQAVSKMKDNTEINLVLMDLKMPVLDGVAATVAIREFNSEVPIIAQTAYGLNHERAETLKFGFDDYITKPINRDRLLTSIDHHLKRG